ncbi:MAG: hypothetical protein EA411_08155 [Saprospirales bacterium]|nr:MAG: hypothetical protein EA411_08155 [Saprospirales bacterium]
MTVHSSESRNFKVDSLTGSAIEFLESREAEIIYPDQNVSPESAQHTLEVMKYEYKTGLNQYLTNTRENTASQTSGICWNSMKRTKSVCGISTNTIWKSLFTIIKGYRNEKTSTPICYLYFRI